MVLHISCAGYVRCLYSEELPLASLGPLTIARASHVDAALDGTWWADLAPLAGPLLGPFTVRSAALAAEAAWLETHWLLPVAAASREQRAAA